MLFSVFIAIHVLVALTLIVVVLLQQGKGADMGAAFGSGASGTVFGSQGSRSFLSKITTYLGIGFFATSLILAVLAVPSGSGDSVLDRAPVSEEVTPAEGEPQPAAGSQDEELTPAPAQEDQQ